MFNWCLLIEQTGRKSQRVSSSTITLAPTAPLRNVYTMKEQNEMKRKGQKKGKYYNGKADVPFRSLWIARIIPSKYGHVKWKNCICQKWNEMGFRTLKILTDLICYCFYSLVLLVSACAHLYTWCILLVMYCAMALVYTVISRTITCTRACSRSLVRSHTSIVLFSFSLILDTHTSHIVSTTIAFWWSQIEKKKFISTLIMLSLVFVIVFVPYCLFARSSFKNTHTNTSTNTCSSSKQMKKIKKPNTK